MISGERRAGRTRRRPYGNGLPGPHRTVAHIHHRGRFSSIDPLQADRPTTRIVEEPDPITKQHRRKMQVDLVNQTAVKKLPSDRGREDLEILALGCTKSDPHRLGHVTVQEGDALDALCVLGMVRQHEDRPVPGAAVRVVTMVQAFPVHDQPGPAGPGRL